MCRVLGVSSSGFYAWRKRPLSARARADVALSAQIAAIHRTSRGTYGAPRVHAELAAQGVRVGRKRVARLMRHAAIHGVSRRKQFRTTQRDKTARPAPDLVQRQFAAPAPTGRARWNTVLATAFDLKVFFSIVDREPPAATPADVLTFIQRQRESRRGATVVRIEDGEPGLA